MTPKFLYKCKGAEGGAASRRRLTPRTSVFSPYASAQSAVDSWWRLSAALESVGAVSYDPEDVLEESNADYDPTPLHEQRATLASVFDEAQARTDDLSWMVWVEFRLTGRDLNDLSVEAWDGASLDAETAAKQRIFEVDATVETVLDERGLLEPNYRKRAEDRGDVGT